MINAKIPFLYGILKIRQFYLNSSSQAFQKKRRGTNIRETTNILSWYTYILVLCYFLWKIRDCHWIINVQIIFMYEILKNNQLNISIASQIFEKGAGELLSERELIFCKHPDNGSALSFLVNEILLFHNTCSTIVGSWQSVSFN